MAGWTHNQCGPCWTERGPGRRPVQLVVEHRRAEACCWCGRINGDGIYVRADPATLRCGGQHPETVSGANEDSSPG